ncbi:MAG TPA: adenylate/guanylate cyclase domain-containing protein [Actinomycetota bacterium]
MDAAPPLEAPLQAEVVPSVRSYVPRLLLRHLAEDTERRAWTVEGTVVFVDISGFTKLSERLAAHGKEGAEQVTEAIETCFTDLLAVAYANGGGLIKFGGDALLLLFQGEGHETLACRSAVWMRRALREVGRIDVPGARVQLRMSVGAHRGTFHLFLVGVSHRELIAVGPAWTRTVEMEHAADAGEILISPELAGALPARCLGAAKGPGMLLRREPPAPAAIGDASAPAVADDEVARCLSVAVRNHVTRGGGAPEHRPVTVAFVHFDGTDAAIERDGPERVAEDLHELVTHVQGAADAQGVCFLGSDVDADGGKIILTAGAPSVSGNDEERMLLALRAIIDGDRAFPVRIGVHRGGVFAGDIGPWYRRTYTVMGDAVNLAARLMGAAPPGAIFATADVLDRSATRLRTTELEPLRVKGKSAPVRAWAIGEAIRAHLHTSSSLPLVGRVDEMHIIDDAIARARAGHAVMVEIVGEAGIGKTRLLDEAAARAPDLVRWHAVCEAYTASTPYAAWRELFREALGIAWEAAPTDAGTTLRGMVERTDRSLLPWLPLLALPLGAEVAATPEVDALDEAFRAPKLHAVVSELLDALLDRPALIQIEDAHHLDESSADLLDALMSADTERAWLVMTSQRASPSTVASPSGDETDRSVRLEVSALSPADALTLAETASDDDPLPPHVIRTVAERSGGNPQFLLDLLQSAVEHGVDDLPETVEAAAMAQIDTLAPSDRTVVRRAAVLGLTFDVRMLAWVLDDGLMPDEATWRRLEALFQDEGGGQIRFRRALMRDAAYEGLPFRVRRQLHSRVADELERSSDSADGSTDDLAATLAIHTALAGDHDRTWRYARVAGDWAREQAAPADAVSHYRHALSAARGCGDVGDADVAAVTEALGEALIRTGELEAADRALRAASRLLAEDPVSVARILLRQAYVAERVGRFDRMLRLTRKASRILEGRPGWAPMRLRAAARVSEAYARQFQGRFEDSLRLTRPAIEAAKTAADRKALADGLMLHDATLLDLGRIDEAVNSREALEIYESLGDLHGAASASNTLGMVAYFQGRWDEAVEAYERFASTKERLGDSVHAATGHMNVGEVRSDQGRIEEAVEGFRRARRAYRAAGDTLGIAYCLAYLGRAHARAGRFDAAEAELTEARTLFASLKAEREMAQTDGWLAECTLLAGRWQEAASSARRLLAAPKGEHDTALLHRVLGEALARTGRIDDARQAFDEALRLAVDEGGELEQVMTLSAIARLWPDEPDAAVTADAAAKLAERLGVVAIAEPPD